jgi:hypothetical protein
MGKCSASHIWFKHTSDDNMGLTESFFTSTVLPNTDLLMYFFIIIFLTALSKTMYKKAMNNSDFFVSTIRYKI